MTQSQKKTNAYLGEQQTISQGQHFKNAVIPKVINLDQKLKEIYPQNHLEKSKKKSSARKSIRPQETAQVLKVSNVSNQKQAGSASNNKGASEKKSSKRQALEKKSEKKKILVQIQESKHKIKGTRTMKLTIKEGNDFLNEDDQKIGGTLTEQPKLQRKSTMNQTINESELYLGRSKSKKVTIDKDARSKTPSKNKSQQESHQINTRSKSNNMKRGRPSHSKDQKKQLESSRLKSKRIQPARSSNKLNKTTMAKSIDKNKSSKKQNQQINDQASLSKGKKTNQPKESINKSSKNRMSTSKGQVVNTKKGKESKEKQSNTKMWNKSSKIDRYSKSKDQVSREKGGKKRKTH